MEGSANLLEIARLLSILSAIYCTCLPWHREAPIYQKQSVYKKGEKKAKKQEKVEKSLKRIAVEPMENSPL